jgi:hypothetical protein
LNRASTLPLPRCHTTAWKPADMKAVLSICPPLPPFNVPSLASAPTPPDLHDIHPLSDPTPKVPLPRGGARHRQQQGAPQGPLARHTQRPTIPQLAPRLCLPTCRYVACSLSTHTARAHSAQRLRVLSRCPGTSASGAFASTLGPPRCGPPCAATCTPEQRAQPAHPVHFGLRRPACSSRRHSRPWNPPRRAAPPTSSLARAQYTPLQ